MKKILLILLMLFTLSLASCSSTRSQEDLNEISNAQMRMYSIMQYTNIDGPIVDEKCYKYQEGYYFRFKIECKDEIIVYYGYESEPGKGFNWYKDGDVDGSHIKDQYIKASILGKKLDMDK